MSAPEIPKKTGAIQITKTGGPEVLELVEIDTPTPEADQFLVKLEYGGVNFYDLGVRSGLYPPSSFPHTVGVEAAGVVVALPTSEAVLEDPAYKKRNIKIGDKVVTRWTPFKGYAAVGWKSVLPLPASISTRVAAASFAQGMPAITFASEAYAVQKGDWILVTAAAGGVGLQLVQVIKAFGGHVIGTTSTAEKAKIVKEYGADHVFLYSDNVVDEVLKITDGEGVKASFDTLGKDTWEDNFKLVARKGSIVSIGNSTGPIPPFQPIKLMPKNLKVVGPGFGAYAATTDETDFYTKKYWDLVDAGLKVHIHKEYPFTSAGLSEAHTDFASRGTVGKLIINIGGASS